MKKYYVLYLLTKPGNKKYLCRNGKFKLNKSEHLTYRSLKKEKVIAVRGFVEGIIGQCLYVEEY